MFKSISRNAVVKIKSGFLQNTAVQKERVESCLTQLQDTDTVEHKVSLSTEHRNLTQR